MQTRKDEDFGKYDDYLAWKFAEEGVAYWQEKVEELRDAMSFRHNLVR